MAFYLGIDIGTSGCKAVVYDCEGSERAMACREYAIICDREGWAELDPDEVIGLCFEIIREVTGQVAPGTIAGMGISSQGEAFTLVDRQGKSLTRALVSSDSRASGQATRWAEEFGTERLYRITGHTPHPMFSLFKLLWIRENQPEIWSRTARILCFEDLLHYRLGLTDPAMGWPLAGRTLLFDVVGHTWCREILDLAGVRAEQLSRPLPSGSVAGIIDPQIAAILGLGSCTFIVTGGHDQPCCGLGAGAILPGVAVLSAGTVECITPAFELPRFTPALRKSNLCTYDHAAPGMYATVAFSLTGGNMLKWFAETLGSDPPALNDVSTGAIYSRILGAMPVQPSRLLALPYFTPTGTPYFDPSARGAVIGLDLSTTRGELLKGLLEGVALEIRLNLEILEESGYAVDELRIIGGGSRSDAWNQLRADAIGKPVTRLEIREAGCRGVAMLALSAHTGRPVRDIAAGWTRTAGTYRPGYKEIYDRKYQQYKQLYPLLRDIAKPLTHHD